MAKNVIIYYSRAGENYFAGEVKVIEKGNTEKLVDKMREAGNFDVFKVVMKNPYPFDYSLCTEKAQEDLNNNARPEILPIDLKIEDYDNIIIAYPNYWGTMPMAMFTFLEGFDWIGKIVYPVVTSEGSGLGNSVSDLRKICLGARICTGLSILGSAVELSNGKVEKWLRENDLV